MVIWFKNNILVKNVVKHILPGKRGKQMTDNERIQMTEVFTKYPVYKE